MTVTKMEADAHLPAAAPRYDSASAAIQQADFEHLPARPDLVGEERDLVVALGDVEQRRFAQAEPQLGRLAEGGSKEVRRRASVARFWVLVHEARWAEIVRVYGDAGEFSTVMPLIRGWESAKPERLVFKAPSATLPASLEDVDMPFVEVRIGDRPFRFLLDTGATFTLITEDVAKAAGIVLSGGPADVATATTRRVAVRPAVLPRLSVGNAVFENHPCVIADPEDLRFKFLLFSFLRVDGILGWPAIRRLDLEIDFRVPEVTIREPRARTVRRNLFWLGAPLVRARFADGVPILAGLDTGASDSWLLPPFFAILPPEHREKLAGKTREGSTRVWGAGGSERLRTQTVERLSVVLDRHLLEFRNIESGRGSLAAVFVPVLQFGNDIALKGTLRIDFTNGALELGP